MLKLDPCSFLKGCALRHMCILILVDGPVRRDLEQKLDLHNHHANRSLWLLRNLRWIPKVCNGKAFQQIWQEMMKILIRENYQIHLIFTLSRQISLATSLKQLFLLFKQIYGQFYWIILFYGNKTSL